MGYTGVLKLLQIMTAKGTVRRDESQRAHVYEAVPPRRTDQAPTRHATCCSGCSKVPPAS